MKKSILTICIMTIFFDILGMDSVQNSVIQLNHNNKRIINLAGERVNHHKRVRISLSQGNRTRNSLLMNPLGFTFAYYLPNLFRINSVQNSRTHQSNTGINQQDVYTMEQFFDFDSYYDTNTEKISYNTNEDQDLNILKKGGVFVNAQELIIDVKHIKDFSLENLLFPSLTSLKICGSDFSSKEEELYDFVLRDCPVVEHVDFCDMKSLNIERQYFSKFPLDKWRFSKLNSLHIGADEDGASYWPKKDMDKLGVLIANVSSSLKKLDIHNTRIQKLPSSIGMCTNLQYLNLQDTDINSFAIEILNLTNLTYLDICCSDEGYINMDYISCFTNLEYLDVGGYNEMEEFPEEICKLIKLKTLIIDHNNIRELPAEIQNLQELTTLDMSGCELTYLPKEIGNLKQLKKLVVSDNDRLDDIPGEIWLLENLQELEFDFPGREDNQDAQGVRELDLSGNNWSLVQLPFEVLMYDNLERLDLSYNKLERIPQLLSKLTKLHELDLRGNLTINSLDQIPPKILELEHLQSIIISIDPDKDSPGETILQKQGKVKVIGKDADGKLIIEVNIAKLREDKMIELDKLLPGNLLTYLNTHYHDFVLGKVAVKAIRKKYLENEELQEISASRERLKKLLQK